MKAFVLESFETEPRYRETPDPQPAEGEVRIRVAASSVNGFDVAVAGGFMRHVLEYRFPAILGSDYAGVVDAVGADVADFARGEEVFGCVRRESLRDGAWAEYVVVPESSGIATKPSTVDMLQAGSLALAGVTALRAVDAVELSEGDAVLVVGATGGVGHYVVQLLAGRGVSVVATARPDGQSFVEQLGATQMVDYAGGDVAAAVRRSCPEGVVAIIDLATPAPDDLTTLSEVVREGGSVVSSRRAADVDALAKRGITGTNVMATTDREPYERLATMVAEGTLHANLDQVFELDRAADAIAAFKRGKRGKIALRVR